mgnify:CR=1 FL=1
MVTLVTSLNAALYQEYGRAMIESFEACSRDVPLLIVFEGDIPADLAAGGRRFSVTPIEGEDYRRFRERFDNLFAPRKNAGAGVGISQADNVACPQCGSDNTTETSHFGSTACKALYRCLACMEPFDYFKPY